MTSEPPADHNQRAKRPSWHRLWMRDSGVMLLSQMAALAMTSTLAILVARSLGPHDFGVFSVGLGLAQALSVVADLGMTTWLLRGVSAAFASRQTRAASLDEAGRHLGAALGITGAISLLLAGGTCVGGYVTGLSLNLGTALFALMAYTGLIAMSFQFEAVMRAKRDLRLVMIATIGEKVIVLGLVAVALTAHFGVLGLATGYVVGGLCRACFGFAVVLHLRIRPQLPSLRRARTVVLAVLPFQLQALAVNMLPQLDVVLVAAVSVSAAGYFATGARITGALMFIPATVSSTLYPWLAREAKPVHASWRVAAVLTLIGSGIAIGGFLAAPTVVSGVFGDRYRAAVPTVQILLATLPITFTCNALIAGLYSDHQERKVFTVTAPSMMVGTLAILAGTILIGPEGAAAGSLLRVALFAVFLGRLARRGMRTEADAARGRPHDRASSPDSTAAGHEATS